MRLYVLLDKFRISVHISDKNVVIASPLKFIHLFSADIHFHFGWLLICKFS